MKKTHTSEIGQTSAEPIEPPKFPPADKDQFLMSFASNQRAIRNINSALLDHTISTEMRENFNTLLNICTRRKNQMLTYAKAQDWL